jgi:pimeloyl-ACP methyl ester carboxylesterase
MTLRRLISLVLVAASLAASCSSDNTTIGDTTIGGSGIGDTTTTTIGNTTVDSSATVDQPIATAPAATAAASTETAGEPWQVAPDGDAFYTPPDDLADRAVGTVIWAQPTSPIDGAVVSKILYVSESLAGERIAVSAMIAVPTASAPATGWPIVTWAHGTTGSADECAPSTSGTLSIPSPEVLAEAGYIVVATDYEGLGTPGLHPYLVADSEARSVLDAARAATTAPGASSTVFTWGWSQGGQASIRAGELAPTYAAELDVVGAVGFAPLAQFSRIASIGATASGLSGFWVPAIAGFAEAYPATLRVEDILSPAMVAELGLLEEGCTDRYFPEFGAVPGAPGIADPLSLPAWADVIEANDAGRAAMTMPLLVLQGTSDAVVPPSLNDLFTADACAAGSTVQYDVRAGEDHGSIVTTAFPDAIAWMTALLAGEPAPTNCQA